jgi:hypothetical protein
MSKSTSQMKDEPCCEVGQCFFRASINLDGKWVCEHHAPSEAAYIRRYGVPQRDTDRPAEDC